MFVCPAGGSYGDHAQFNLTAGANGSYLGYGPLFGSISPDPITILGQTLSGLYEVGGYTLLDIANTGALDTYLYADVYINGRKVTFDMSNPYTLWATTDATNFVNGTTYLIGITMRTA
jgi:hypothetical protein